MIGKLEQNHHVTHTNEWIQITAGIQYATCFFVEHLQMRAYAVAVVLLLVIFGAIGGYLYQRFSALAAMDFSPPPVTIAASVATAQEWKEVLNAVGSIQAVRGVELTSETSGEVTAIHFDSGDKVDAGDVLIVLNDEIEHAARQNQIASLELAQILFDRDSTLIQQKSIPQSQYDQSRADLQRAKAQLAETEARLANKKIAAPFTGTMGIRKIDLGDYVSPGTVIANLQDHSELEIDFTVPARYAPKLKSGLSVGVSVDAYPGKAFDARITAIDSRIDPGTRNILLRATLNQPEGLLPGMFATLEIDLGETLQVITVPETAMTYSLQGDTVYVVEETEDGSMTAVAKIVETGVVKGGQVAINSGIEAGDRVVSVGQNKLYRGVKILIDDSVNL